MNGILVVSPTLDRLVMFIDTVIIAEQSNVVLTLGFIIEILG